MTATTGLVHATWSLLIGGGVADTATASGDFRLRGVLPDGSTVTADIHQSLLGTSTAVVSHDGREVESFTGFVL